MSCDYIKTFKLEVGIQENGIIRDPFGWIIGRCDDDWLKLVTRHEISESDFTARDIRVNGSEIEEASDDYKQAAEYWQRMYEQTFAERTCYNVSTTNNFRCSECDAADLDFDKPSYCHGCGCKVVGE